MSATILTTEDLYDFKLELFGELQQLLKQSPQPKLKKFLESVEVTTLKTTFYEERGFFMEDILVLFTKVHPY